MEYPPPFQAIRTPWSLPPGQLCGSTLAEQLAQPAPQRQQLEVHVDAEAYEDTSDADADTELHEYLSDPMRLLEGEIVGVVTDPRLIATYAEQGPSYVVTVKWDRPLSRSTSPVLPCREDES